MRNISIAGITCCNHSQWLVAAKAAAQKEDASEFDGIVLEALRFVPITSYLFRTAVSDYTAVKGTNYETVLRAGTYVLPVTLSAMFDEPVFEPPDQFIPQRNWYNYSHFGFGDHECLGRYVGMVMIPEMVRQVLLSNDIDSKGDIDYKSGPFPESYDLF